MTDAQIFQTSYDRADCEIGIVHVGFGAFHRAHQAVYFDDFMHKTGDLRWGIAAVNLRAQESDGFATAAADKNGYLVKSIAPDGTLEFRVVRAHCAFLDAATDLDAALDIVAQDSVKAITMTVTETGYYFAEDWSLDLSAEPVADELAGGGLQTIYGYLAQALGRRFAAGGAPITLMCCDNIRSNGHVLEGALLNYLKAAGKDDLLAWAKDNVTFPCSMVDRITPRATDELRDHISQLFPAYAETPIHAEDFSQWVLEDKFASDMPDLREAGVQIVADVEPYEEAKIRILNGGHTGLAYLGALAGHDTFDEAMRDSSIRDHFDRWEKNEVLAGLEGVVPFDTTAYLAEIASRFENPGIADQLERICMDGYAKMAIYVRPTLRACLDKGITPKAGYDCAASWVVYARKYRDGTTAIPYHDPSWDKLEPMLAKGQEEALASDPLLWGDLPQRFENFVPELVTAIQRMEDKWQA